MAFFWSGSTRPSTSTFFEHAARFVHVLGSSRARPSPPAHGRLSVSLCGRWYPRSLDCHRKSHDSAHPAHGTKRASARRPRESSQSTTPTPPAQPAHPVARPSRHWLPQLLPQSLLAMTASERGAVDRATSKHGCRHCILVNLLQHRRIVTLKRRNNRTSGAPMYQVSPDLRTLHLRAVKRTGHETQPHLPHILGALEPASTAWRCC